MYENAKRIIERGNIYWLDVDKYVAKEQTHVNKKTRPFLILQNNTGNKYSPTCFGAIITSSTTKKQLPTHVMLGEESGLKNSIVLMEQLITVDQIDLGDYIGKVPFDKMLEVDMAFAISGGLKINNNNAEIFDIQKANSMLKTLKDTEDMLQLADNDYFRTVKELIISELKTYCDRCGVNYQNLLKRGQNQYSRGLGDVISV